MRRPSLVMLVLGCAGFLLAGCDCEGPSGRLPEFTKSDSAVEAARNVLRPSFREESASFRWSLWAGMSASLLSGRPRTGPLGEGRRGRVCDDET